MKKKKHNKLVSDYSKQRSNHLEKLATKMLKNEEISTKLKKMEIDPKFLNLF